VVTQSQEAPGDLERVRALLNSFVVPNDTREPRDDLAGWLHEEAVPPAETDDVERLRNELRLVLEGHATLDATAARWIDRHAVRPAVRGGVITFEAEGSTAGGLAVVVLGAVRDATFGRLKACPDCRWVFYDNSRNGSKRWCLMNAAGPGSRACGNIAKARRHRERAQRR
jgi:predicted RNA-binding Zn ribbon-like protein